MKPLLILLSVWVACPLAGAIELQAIHHKTIGDQRTFVRDATDLRYSVWTDDAEKARELLASFGLQSEGFSLKKGEVLVVFLNDRIEEDLVQITRNKTARQVFADYADSGIRFKLRAPGEGKKYSHITAVVFTPEETPSHLGLRGMMSGGLSEKK